ncbi:MAG TPA: hypothetical protein VEF04_15490 [Blastocatellia bacterium]|nr:hypothetical protein [Blastocatellia bacterium]
MSRIIFYLVFAAIISLPIATAAQSKADQSRNRPQTREILTNESVINLVKAGFKEKTVISIILSSPVSFDVTTPKLIELKKRGVSERIVLMMMQRQEMMAQGYALSDLQEDQLFFRPEDEEFFNAPPKLKIPSEQRGSNDGNESSVFGSRSGSQSRTSRGGLNGESSNEGEVSGSAKVRIIRPPSEGSSNGPKLERARKLDNQAIIDMAQAFFSDGTIIRKIENTHVDFDLSESGLAELRRNRVSDRVIKAMQTAMEEDQPSKNEK